MGDEKPAESVPTTADGRDARYERWRWQIFAITWLAYAGFYLTRQSFSAAKVELVKPDVMGWKKDQLAAVDSAYLMTYALGQFVWGPLGDRFGPRVVILIGMLASVVTAAFMGASSALLALVVLSAVQGVCQSSGWAPLTKNVGEFFTRTRRGGVLGAWCTNYTIGAMAAAWIAGFAAEHWGWRYAFWVPAAGLTVIWVLVYFFQRNRPEDVGLPPVEDYRGEPADVVIPGDTPAAEPEGSWAVIRAVLATPMVWLLALEYFLLKPVRYLFLLWAPLYVSERLATGAMESGVIGSIFQLAGLPSVILFGYLSDRVFGSRRVPITVIALVGAGLLVIAFPELPATEWAIVTGLFAIGFFVYVADSLISATAAVDFGTRRGASTAAGFINACGSIGAIVGGTLPGWIEKVLPAGADLWGWGFRGLGVGLLVAAAILVPQWNRLPATAAPKK